MTEHKFGLTSSYEAWFSSLKTQIREVQLRAARAVNQELVLLYWQMGREILDKQINEGWGAKVIDRLSADLVAAFPDMKGFSVRNLKYMRKFAESWPEKQIVQQLVAQLPWGHQIILLDRFDKAEERLTYIRLAVEYGWSRNTLVHHIELKTAERSGLSLNNFDTALPPAISDLARETLKDPYKFDFLSLGKDADEKQIEKGLVDKLKEFLIELGIGFAFVGQQVPLLVDGEEFFIDLLFYHLKLHCYIVIELKTGRFRPEHLGQLNFYVNVIDAQRRTDVDSKTIGLLLCKTKCKVVVEYSLKNIEQPIGVSSYEYNICDVLPSVEVLERCLD